jgi:gas vesicle protein
MTDCTCKNHGDSSSFTAGLLLGLVTGAASAHFLMSTERGKELLKTLKDNAGDAIKEIGDNPVLAEKIADLQKTMDAARATINNAAEKVAEATEEVKPTPKKNFFQKMGASLGK